MSNSKTIKPKKEKTPKQKKLERKFWLIFGTIKLVILVLMILFLYVFYKNYILK
jgi:hypothetical protein